MDKAPFFKKSDNKKILFIWVIFTGICFIFFQKPLYAQISPVSSSQETLIQGYKAYQKSDWTSAVFLLKKASLQKSGLTADTLYMLINAQMHCGEYQNASADCDLFLKKYPKSNYAPYVEYQEARAFFYIGNYNKTVLLLSDFCHQYPTNEMYPSALFWIAESFYAGNNYKTALPLYKRIVKDFPEDVKNIQAQYRIDTILQKNREEKLIYLLKVVGEEYLATKESYEKKLKIYESYDAPALAAELKDYKQKYKDIQAQLDAEEQKVNELNQKIQELSSGDKSSRIEELKRKAQEAQSLLDQQTVKEENKK